MTGIKSQKPLIVINKLISVTGSIDLEREASPERPEPRSSTAIFEDLRVLAQSDGALHEISAIIYRDWIVTVDTQGGGVIDDPEVRWSTSKLNKNELMLLLGLTVQSQSDRTYSIQVSDNTFAARADTLLREFHDRVMSDCKSTFYNGAMTESEALDTIGPIAREAIYYGAESFYLHQFIKFSRQRYRDDMVWLLENVGISIRPINEIAKFITDRINAQITDVGLRIKEGQNFTHGELTSSLMISKFDIINIFGKKAISFLKNFSTSATNTNAKFLNPFSLNSVAIYPIIEIGNFLYVPNQYRLFESIYESPFYWMLGDKFYRNIAANHRGEFLEKAVSKIFRSVFGTENVYENVTIRIGSKDIAGEIDVLVVYGDFILVTQAKSKRVTLNARAGNAEALKEDFKGAIQDPYQQALKCMELISKGAKCYTKNGDLLVLQPYPRLFPVVILSDPFPASTFLSRAMLKRRNNIAPVIWDIGGLDCVARIFPSPIELIYYLKSRSEVFDTVISDNEYSYIGYHIKSKLTLSSDFTLMILDRDLASVVDDYMIASDVGVTVDRPLGILESNRIPVISDLLYELRSADPKIASVVIDFYEFSYAALEDISSKIINIRKEVRVTGKAIKSFSISTKTGGFTYAVTQRRDEISAQSAKAIGSKYKYDTKSDRWYVILDSVETDNPIDMLLLAVWPWKEDESEESNSQQVAALFNSRFEKM